jgi:RHS repeat-associated protein
LMSVEGAVTTYYAWAGGQIIAEYEASGTNALVWRMSYVYMGGKLLATDQAEGIRYHHPDQLGTRLVTDASDGSVISEQLTMPFGTQIPYGSTLGGDNSWQNPGRSNLSKKKFTSYDRSDATGLDYAVNRFYSSQQGRFTQVDPIGMSAASLGDPQTLNLYAYCGNDPINNDDPKGLFWGAIGRFFKAVGIAIANFFSAKIGGYSRPGFRTPPTFPGNTPSTISVSSGKNVNFRTPPFVNGFAGSSVGGVGSFIDGESGNCGGPGERPCINGITLRVETWELEKDLLGIALEFAQKSDLPGIHYHPDPDEPDHLEMGITWGALLKVLARWGLRGGRAASGAAQSSRILRFTQRNLQKGFTKHGADFGLKGNWNPSRAAEFSAAVNQHINSAGVRAISGSYRGVSGYTHYLGPRTGLNVVTDSAGNYVTGYRLGANQMRDVLTTGHLW